MGSEVIREYRPLRECTSTGSVSYGIVQPGSPVENGVPIIRVNNINDGSLDITSPLKVDPQIDEKHRKTRLEGGEVLLSLVGTTGQCVVAGPELKGWNVARAIAVIKPAQGVSAEWISICLKSQAAQHYLDSRANTTVQKTLNLQDVREIPIMVVSETEERYILEWWTTLNDKIELNRRMNATLEGMAQALFKSWFVDFDPVIDNALAAGNPIPEEFSERAEVRRQILEGNDGDSRIPDTALRDSAIPKSEGTRQVTSEARNKLALRAEVRKKALAISGEPSRTNGTTQQASVDHPTLSDPKSLFPDAFRFTEELGWIPEGWTEGTIGHVADVIDCLHSKKPVEESEDTGHILLQLANIKDDGLLDLSSKYFISEEMYKKWTSRMEAQEGDFVITNVGRVGACSIVPRKTRAALGRNMTGIRLKGTPRNLVGRRDGR